MVIDKTVNVKVDARTYEYYCKRGYDIKHTFYGNGNIRIKRDCIINVKIEDLKSTSRVKVNVKCDKCGAMYPREYCWHVKIGYDLCSVCQKKKMKETIDYKLESGIYENFENDNKYFTGSYNETVKYIDNYIKENNSLKNIAKSNPTAHARMKHFGINLRELVEELGYCWWELDDKFYQLDYYTKENLIKEVKSLQEYLGCFPSHKELKAYGISTEFFNKHFGSYKNLCKHFGYVDAYIDKSGYICKSSYEQIFANYLIDNNIKFNREERPFIAPDNYISDFTLYKNNEKYYVEIWGLYGAYNRKMSSVVKEYTRKYEIKQGLYNKYNLNLISLYRTDFKSKKNLTYKNLDSIIGDKYDKATEKIETNNWYKLRMVRDVDAFKHQIFDVFGVIEYLPSQTDFHNHKSSVIYSRLLKAFGNIKDCADALGLITKREYSHKKKIA